MKTCKMCGVKVENVCPNCGGCKKCCKCKK